MSSFRHISQSSCSDDGLWAKKTDSHTYAVIEFSYWEDLDSSAIATHGKYNIQAGYVSTDNPDHNVQAVKSCGWRIGSEGIVNDYDGTIVAEVDTHGYWLCLVECLWRYGHKDIYLDESGNNRARLFKRARGAV